MIQKDMFINYFGYEFIIFNILGLISGALLMRMGEVSYYNVYVPIIDFLVMLSYTVSIPTIYFCILFSFPDNYANASEGFFPEYGKFISVSYWKRPDKEHIIELGIFALGFTLFCLFYYLATLVSYYAFDYKSAFHSLVYLNQQLNIISDVVGGVAFNGLFIGMFLKMDFDKPKEQRDLDYLLFKELITVSEHEEMEQNIRKKKNSLYTKTFQETLCLRTLEKRILLITVLSKQQQQAVNIFYFNAPTYEIPTQKTYDLLQQLVSDEKFDILSQIRFDKEFVDFREELIERKQINKGTWSFTEVLEKYLLQRGLKN